MQTQFHNYHLHICGQFSTGGTRKQWPVLRVVQADKEPGARASGKHVSRYWLFL